MQVRRRPVRDGLGAVLGGVLTCYFWYLKYRSDLTVLTGNFQTDLIVICKRYLVLPRVLSTVLSSVLSKYTNLGLSLFYIISKLL